MAGRFAVAHEVLDPHEVVAALLGSPSTGAGAQGAVITFSGLVRAANQGHQVLRLEYEGYEPMIVKVFEQIDREIAAAWPGAACAIHHRVGTLAPGDTSIIIVTASPHRGAAYAASRYAIERVKQIAPIWKHEYFVWIEGAVAAADDEGARARAMETACG